MTTIKNFAASSNIPASLIRAVIRQVGGFDSFKELARDVVDHGANAGVSGFVYYSDTVPFTKRNKAILLEFAENEAQSFGENAFSMIASFRCIDLTAPEVAEALYNARSENRTEVFNALAWYALEEICRSYVDMLENDSE